MSDAGRTSHTRAPVGGHGDVSCGAFVTTTVDAVVVGATVVVVLVVVEFVVVSGGTVVVETTVLVARGGAEMTTVSALSLNTSPEVAVGVVAAADAEGPAVSGETLPSLELHAARNAATASVRADVDLSVRRGIRET